ncbi:MAG: ribosomal protein S18-alanine N-acetyltransferase [Amylibacter sp.]|nr:ribosomal protein S18-alanine N-acetyltransferase [Amylibacter sp.]
MTPQQMAQIHAQCFSQPRPWSVQEFIDLLESNTVYQCAREQGFALGRIAGPEVELLTLAVDPEHRRQGVAQALMKDFETQAKARGASDAFLEVAQDNTAATALYQQLGFTQAGYRKDYYAGPKGIRICALVMTKTL